MQERILYELGRYHDAYLETDWLSAKVIKHVLIHQEKVEIEIRLGYPFKRIAHDIEAQIKAKITSLVGEKPIEIKLLSHIEPHVGRTGMSPHPAIKNIIVIASGKGGVGKSTVAVNIALALAMEGAKVGLLDADIYGPSQPAMLGAEGERPIFKDKSFLPVIRHGIQSMSIGYLIDQDTPMIWRGPMIGKAMHQLLYDTQWEALDYLIIDLPPGTGDIQLSLCQKVPVSGAVMVTTPQDLALLDVRRACEMFKKLNVSILGIVENMSGYHCPACGHHEAIFGQGGGQKLAHEESQTLLASIPLSLSIREMTDHGKPPVILHPPHQHADVFYTAARKIAAKLSLQNKDYSAKFPKIVVTQGKN